MLPFDLRVFILCNTGEYLGVTCPYSDPMLEVGILHLSQKDLGSRASVVFSVM